LPVLSIKLVPGWGGVRASVFDAGKALEAREWISNEETRIARSGKNAAWTAATAAIISAIMATISAVLAVLLFHR
jgi:hypothetical protein